MNSTPDSIVKANVAVAQLIAKSAAIGNNVRFIGVTYRSKSTGELARHVFNVGVSYVNTLKTSIELLGAKVSTLNGIQAEAGKNVMASLTKSLTAHLNGEQSEDFTKKGMYEPVCTGIKASLNDGTLELCGMSVSKVVLEPGIEKPDTRRPLTKAQDALKYSLPISKFRTLAIDMGALESVRIGGTELEVSQV
jgi:hypothetical protein